MSETRFICGHGDFPNPCPICQGTSHNAVFDRLPVQPIAPQSSYSITPEGAKSAAAEIYWAESKVRSAVSWCNINDIAVIILRHAEQVDARQIVEAVLKFVTADEGVIRCEVDRAVREIEELRRAEQSSHDVLAGAATAGRNEKAAVADLERQNIGAPDDSEGEMREALRKLTKERDTLALTVESLESALTAARKRIALLRGEAANAD